MRHRALVVSSALSISLCLAALALPAFAQTVARIDGRVQWIAGGKLMLIPRAGGLPVNVDLGRVPQEQYANLREGSLVRVEGEFSTDGRRLVASALAPTGEREERIDGQPVTIPNATTR